MVSRFMHENRLEEVELVVCSVREEFLVGHDTVQKHIAMHIQCLNSLEEVKHGQ